MDSTDMTPEEFHFPKDTWYERSIKKRVRRFAYPVYNYVNNRWLSKKYGHGLDFHVDLWLYGQRGNDFETHRRRVNNLQKIRGSHILVAGCGTGRDIPSWMVYEPKTLIGVDLLNYLRAWEVLGSEIQRDFPATRVKFLQADLSDLGKKWPGEFNLVASDAVFEHVSNLPNVVSSLSEVLKPGGLLYATFGPLWYCWGGDHISGYDEIGAGYNHLLLSDSDYRDYLYRRGKIDHPEHDGRTWIQRDLFSYLKPNEYIAILDEAGLIRKFISMIIDPRAVEYLTNFGENRKQLLDLVDSELDLIVSGMTIIFQKPSS